MNPGSIKWNITITATIDGSDISPKDIRELRKDVKEFNKEVKAGKYTDMETKGMIVVTPKKTDETEPPPVLSLDFSTTTKSPYVLDSAFRGMANQMKFLNPVIDDRDWDYSCIIDFLKFKIQNTCKYIEKKQRYLNWERDVKWMRLSIKLMDKLWSNEYSDITPYESEYSKYHKTEIKWFPVTKKGKVKPGPGMTFDEMLNNDSKDSLQMESTELWEKFDEYFSKNKLMHKKALAFLASEKGKGWQNPGSKVVQAMVISQLKHAKAKRLLFSILAEKIEQWWD